MTKKRKRWSWEAWYIDCDEAQPCPCGQSLLCTHPEMERADGICDDKDDCPTWRERNRKPRR